MSKAVLISIHPEWCEKIVSCEKTIEVRKTRPKLQTPFKCYIYCTNGPRNRLVGSQRKVIGEFVCDRIQKTFEPAGGLVDVIDCEQSCLTAREIISYAGGKALYFWHISELKIYDKPMRLQRIYGYCGLFSQCETCGDKCPVRGRPPQSWCYVEELT